MRKIEIPQGASGSISFRKEASLRDFSVMKFCPGLPIRILTWKDPDRGEAAGKLRKTSGEVLGERNLSRGGELVAGQAAVLVLDFAGLVVVRIVAEIGHRRRELLLELRV